MNTCAQRTGGEGGRGRGLSPHKPAVQGQSEGTRGSEAPSALPGHRGMETPKCLAPSAEGEWQALGKEGCTDVLKTGEFPQRPCPSPEQAPVLPQSPHLEWGDGPRSLPAPLGMPPICANLTLVTMLLLTSQPVPLQILLCSRHHLHSVTHYPSANFAECQLCVRPTQSPRSHHLPDPAD